MTTEQQDILCETTNLILLSPYLRLPQDQKVNPEKVIFYQMNFSYFGPGDTMVRKMQWTFTPI